MDTFEGNKVNKYLIAYTKYRHYFSAEIEVATYCTEAENMKDAVKKTKEICSVLDIISITTLDESINWGDL